MEGGHPNPSEGSSCVSRSGENSRTLKHGWELFGQRKARVLVWGPPWRQEPLGAQAGNCMDITRSQEAVVLMEMSRRKSSSHEGRKAEGPRLWRLQVNLNEA